MGNFKKFVVREKASKIVKKKHNYWDNFDYKPSYELASNEELVTYVNNIYLLLADKNFNLDKAKCENAGFRYDEAITDSFEFYLVNQKELERRYLMEV
tara:strand:+ start:240 stop:533 length:294 start_codon:yes stop_codon:yes gene_type:complete